MKLTSTRTLAALALAALLCAAQLARVRASATSSAAGGADAPLSLPFQPGEELIYQADFSRSLLRGIEIAEFHFVTERAPAAAQPSAPADVNTAAPGLIFTGDVNAKGWFRKLFGIDFHYRQESLVDAGTLRIRRTKKLDEQGRRVRESEAVFDPKADRVTWTERDPNDLSREPRVVTNPMGAAAYDVVSAIYYLRTRALAPGQSFELPVSDSGETYGVPVKVVRRETLKTAVGKVSTLRVEVGLFGERGLVNDRKGEMTMWITEDARRLPVRARLKADVGTLDIKLKKFTAATPVAAGRK